MATRDELLKQRVDYTDTVLRTREAIRRWVAHSRVERRKRRSFAQLSPHLKRDVGFDRHAV